MEEYKKSAFKNWLKERTKQKKEIFKDDDVSTTVKPQVIKIAPEVINHKNEIHMNGQITELIKNGSTIEIPENMLAFQIFENDQMTEMYENGAQMIEAPHEIFAINNEMSKNGLQIIERCGELIVMNNEISSDGTQILNLSPEMFGQENGIPTNSPKIVTTSQETFVVESETPDNTPRVITVTNFKIIQQPEFTEEMCVQLEPESSEMMEDLDNYSLMPDNSEEYSGTELLPKHFLQNVNGVSNEVCNIDMVEDLGNQPQIQINLTQSLGTNLSPECLPKNMKSSLNEVCQTLEEIYSTYHDIQEGDEDIDAAFCNVIKMLLQNVSHEKKREIQKKILTVVKDAVQIL